MSENTIMGKVVPCEPLAYARIISLANAILRECDAKGDIKQVERYAKEIGWQCAMIDAMKED